MEVKSLNDLAWELAEYHSITLYEYPNFAIWEEAKSGGIFKTSEEWDGWNRRQLWSLFKSIMEFRAVEGDTESTYGKHIDMADKTLLAFRKILGVLQDGR